ncbi:MAG: hypothetical protein HUK01_09980, partial [Bacteroidaceae bacterium]|nr:hypothetical protein [Bacteroidaceae bacterium]
THGEDFEQQNYTFILYSLFSTLYTLHSTLYSLHSTLYTLLLSLS